jgi:hypothetical protein
MKKRRLCIIKGIKTGPSRITTTGMRGRLSAQFYRPGIGRIERFFS